eukprot:3114723-Amphidinium_carterae.1
MQDLRRAALPVNTIKMLSCCTVVSQTLVLPRYASLCLLCKQLSEALHNITSCESHSLGQRYVAQVTSETGSVYPAHTLLKAMTTLTIASNAVLKISHRYWEWKFNSTTGLKHLSRALHATQTSRHHLNSNGRPKHVF